MTTRLRATIITVALAVAGQALAQVPDLSPWDGVWMKAKAKQKGVALHVDAPGVQRGHDATVVYLQLHVDPQAPEPLSADAWVREDQWVVSTIPLLYLAGTADQFAAYFNQVPVTPDPVVAPMLHLAYVLLVRGKIVDGAVRKGSVKSVGGYFIEVADAPGSDQRFAGSLSLKGKTTVKLPADLPAS